MEGSRGLSNVAMSFGISVTEISVSVTVTETPNDKATFERPLDPSTYGRYRFKHFLSRSWGFVEVIERYFSEIYLSMTCTKP